MTKLLAIFDLVPGWLYAAALLSLCAYCLWLDASVSLARGDQAMARAELATVKQSAASAALTSTQSARDKEQVMSATQTGAIDDLHKALSATAGRAADLDRRMRDIAHAHASAGGASLPTGAQTARGSDGPPAAGLSELARGDLVRLAASANDTADTLKTCRVLLRQAWQVTE